MKSIVQEASSIAKAIEKSLEKAANPRDFSVKILEYPEKNFFGLTTKPAKIALYFDDKNRKTNDAHPLVTSDKDDGQRVRLREKSGNDQEGSRAKGGNNPQVRKQGQGQGQRKPQDSYGRSQEPRSMYNNNRRTEEPSSTSHDSFAEEAQPSFQENSRPNPLAGRQRREESVIRWNSEIIEYANEWLTRILTEMHHLVPFTLEVDRFHIKITLERPLFEDSEHERRVLASLSLLMLETCKHTFKVNLRDHRVILTHRN